MLTYFKIVCIVLIYILKTLVLSTIFIITIHKKKRQIPCMCNSTRQ